MWYLKKTAQSVWSASKNLLQKRTPVQKLIDSIAQSQQQFLPTNKLSQLAAMTYQLEQFDEIVQILYQRIKKFQYDVYESHKTLNILIAINYLIKHGASGFVDVFRKYVGVFKKYEGLKSEQTYEDRITQSKLDVNLQKIKSRAHHIAQLLQDKQKLLKQKELSMLVKQKLKLYEKDKLSQLNNQKYSNINSRALNKQKNEHTNADNNNSQGNWAIQNISNKTKALLSNPQQLSIKLQALLQTYVWKYVDKLDESIETASQKVMQQIDKYVLGQQQVHPFEAENNVNDDEDDLNEHPVGKITKAKNDKEDDDLMQKLQQQTKDIKQNQNTNLLQFEQVQPAKHPDPKQVVDLI